MNFALEEPVCSCNIWWQFVLSVPLVCAVAVVFPSTLACWQRLVTCADVCFHSLHSLVLRWSLQDKLCRCSDILLCTHIKVLSFETPIYRTWFLQRQKVRCFWLVCKLSGYPPSALKWDSLLKIDFL